MINWIARIDQYTNNVTLIDLTKEYGVTKKLTAEELEYICCEWNKIDGATYIPCYDL